MSVIASVAPCTVRCDQLTVHLVSRLSAYAVVRPLSFHSRTIRSTHPCSSRYKIPSGIDKKRRSRLCAPGLLIKFGFARTFVHQRDKNEHVSSARGSKHLRETTNRTHTTGQCTKITRATGNVVGREASILPEFAGSVRLGWPPPARKVQPERQLGRRRLSEPPASRCTTLPNERNPRL